MIYRSEAWLAKRLKDERELAFSLAVGAALMYGIDESTLTGYFKRKYGGEISREIDKAQKDYNEYIAAHPEEELW